MFENIGVMFGLFAIFVGPFILAAVVKALLLEFSASLRAKSRPRRRRRR